jgi:hypothetical protein
MWKNDYPPVPSRGLSTKIMGGNCLSCGKPRNLHGVPDEDDPLGCNGVPVSLPPVEVSAPEPGCTCPDRCLLHNDQPPPGELRGESVLAPARKLHAADDVEVAVGISSDPETGGVSMTVAPQPSPEETEVRDALEGALLTDAAREAFLRGPVPPGFRPWSKVLERWLALGRAGLTVSICYGPTKRRGVFSFSVDALSSTGESFEQPFSCESFEQAVEIAEIEAVRRGWLPQ